MNDAQLVTTIASIALSLILAYAPKVKVWWGKQDGDTKRMVLGGCILLAGLGELASSCAGLWVVYACNQQGMKDAAAAVIFALIANQATYKFLVEGRAANALPAPAAPQEG